MPKITPNSDDPETWRGKEVTWPIPLAAEDRAAVEIIRRDVLHNAASRASLLRGLVRLGIQAAAGDAKALALAILSPSDLALEK